MRPRSNGHQGNNAQVSEVRILDGTRAAVAATTTAKADHAGE